MSFVLQILLCRHSHCKHLITALYNSQITITALYNSQITITALYKSQITITALYNSQITITALYNSQITITALYNSQITITALYNSQITIAALYNSQITITALYKSQITISSTVLANCNCSYITIMCIVLVTFYCRFLCSWPSEYNIYIINYNKVPFLYIPPCSVTTYPVYTHTNF